MLVTETKPTDVAQPSVAAPRRFARGEKASVSVRLGRSSRYEVSAVKKVSSRLSGDFGEWMPVAALNEGKAAMPDDNVDGGFRRKSITISPLKDVMAASASSAMAGSPSKRFPFYRGGANAHEATKTCNSEFSFARGMDQGVPASTAETRPQSMAAVALRRVPGLGRRAATQLQMEVRPQSMMVDSNLCRSQENLVQLSRASSMAPSSSGTPPAPPTGPALRKGALWTQRDRLFSKWKERYFVLSADALCCFRTSAADECMFRLRLCDVDGVELLDRRGYLTVCLATARDGRVFLRKADGITEWYNQIKKCLSDISTGDSNSRSPGSAYRSTRQATDSVSIEQWVKDRKKKALSSNGLSGSSPDIHKPAECNVATSATSAGGGERRITLEELSALYRQQEEDEAVEEQMARPRQAPVTSSAMAAAHPAAPGHVRMRPAVARHAHANRLSLMTDLEMLALDGRSRGSGVCSPLSRLPDTAINDCHRDSGHHSLSTNASVSSSGSSRSRDSREDCDQARSNGSSHGVRMGVSSRRSSQPLGVQVTHV